MEDEKKSSAKLEYTGKEVMWLVLGFALIAAMMDEFGITAYSVFCLSSSWLFVHLIFIRPLKLNDISIGIWRGQLKKFLALVLIVLFPVAYIVLTMAAYNLLEKLHVLDGIIGRVFSLFSIMASPWWLYMGSVLVPFDAYVKKGSPPFASTYLTVSFWLLTVMVILLVSRKRGIRSAAILLILVWSLVASLIALSMERSGYRFDMSGFMP